VKFEERGKELYLRSILTKITWTNTHLTIYTRKSLTTFYISHPQL